MCTVRRFCVFGLVWWLSILPVSFKVISLILGQAYAILQWRLNERDGVSNHRRTSCLLNRFLRLGSKKTSKLRGTGLCEGNSQVTGEFPAQRAIKAEHVSIWWRHHECQRGAGNPQEQRWMNHTNLQRRNMYSQQHNTQQTRWYIMTSSNGSNFRVTGRLCGEFIGDRVHYDVTVMCNVHIDAICTLTWKQIIGWAESLPSKSDIV